MFFQSVSEALCVIFEEFWNYFWFAESFRRIYRCIGKQKFALISIKILSVGRLWHLSLKGSGTIHMFQLIHAAEENNTFLVRYNEKDVPGFILPRKLFKVQRVWAVQHFDVKRFKRARGFSLIRRVFIFKGYTVLLAKCSYLENETKDIMTSIKCQVFLVLKINTSPWLIAKVIR